MLSYDTQKPPLSSSSSSFHQSGRGWLVAFVAFCQSVVRCARTHATYFTRARRKNNVCLPLSEPRKTRDNKKKCTHTHKPTHARTHTPTYQQPPAPPSRFTTKAKREPHNTPTINDIYIPRYNTIWYNTF